MSLDLALKRRTLLINEMAFKEEKGLHCGECKGGNCCTFELNSMMITPLEAADILVWLSDKKNEDELRSELHENIQKWGLDRPTPGNGRRLLVRRTYTCPFFKGSALGCSLSRSVKPYGCLAFNPNRPHSLGPQECRSNQELLSLQHDSNSDQEHFNAKLSMAWDKLPISLALIELLKLSPLKNWAIFPQNLSFK